MSDVKKKTGKKKKAARSANDTVFALSAPVTAPTYLYGNVTRVGDEIVIDHKKKRTKKYRITRRFTVDQVMGYATGSEADGAWVLVNTTHNIVDEFATGVTVKNGEVHATLDNGLQAVFFTKRCDLQTAAEVAVEI